eukprot:TRINITY_DN66820_c4_g1_i2.p2 TRINITY_DN66820_c4_g1~~TRINITY_DN66820_c4_g1_i2.p2  ORF type:complete len:170 (-),score=88.57 TRINITY_DN66820_c4_g1_i2:90-539(-)
MLRRLTQMPAVVRRTLPQMQRNTIRTFRTNTQVVRSAARKGGDNSNIVYKSLFKGNARYITVVAGAAVVANLYYDWATDYVWESLNKGKLYKDIIHKYPNLPPGLEEEDDEDDDDDDDDDEDEDDDGEDDGEGAADSNDDDDEDDDDDE